MNRVVNLTPHAIVVQLSGGSRVTFPPDGTVARVKAVPGTVALSDFQSPATGDPVAIPVALPTSYGEVEGLPAPAPETVFIVSGMVGAALKGARGDVVMPGTGPNDGAIRDEGGKILAVTRLVYA